MTTGPPRLHVRQLALLISKLFTYTAMCKGGIKSKCLSFDQQAAFPSPPICHSENKHVQIFLLLWAKLLRAADNVERSGKHTNGPLVCLGGFRGLTFS